MHKQLLYDIPTNYKCLATNIVGNDSIMTVFTFVLITVKEELVRQLAVLLAVL